MPGRTIYMCDKVKAHFERLEAQRNAFTPEDEQIRQQNQRFIIDTNGEKISSLELVNTLPNGKIQTVNSMKYHSRVMKQKYDIDFKISFSASYVWNPFGNTQHAYAHFVPADGTRKNRNDKEILYRRFTKRGGGTSCEPEQNVKKPKLYLSIRKTYKIGRC